MTREDMIDALLDHELYHADNHERYKTLLKIGWRGFENMSDADLRWFCAQRKLLEKVPSDE